MVEEKVVPNLETPDRDEQIRLNMIETPRELQVLSQLLCVHAAYQYMASNGLAPSGGSPEASQSNFSLCKLPRCIGDEISDRSLRSPLQARCFLIYTPMTTSAASELEAGIIPQLGSNLSHVGIDCGSNLNGIGRLQSPMTESLN